MKKILKLLYLVALSIITALAFTACELNQSSKSEDVTDEAGKTAFTNLVTYMSADTTVAPDSYSISMILDVSLAGDDGTLQKLMTTNTYAAVCKTGANYEAIANIDATMLGMSTKSNNYLTQDNGQYYQYVETISATETTKNFSRVDLATLEVFNLDFYSSLSE